MSYVFRQKFDIRELVTVDEPAKRVLVIEPEEYLLALYSYHLSRHNFFVRSCPQVDAAIANLTDFAPHVCVINAQLWGSSQATAKKLRWARQRFPGLMIVTIGTHTAPEELRELMDSGINAHVDRKLSKPADVAEIVKILLNH